MFALIDWQQLAPLVIIWFCFLIGILGTYYANKKLTPEAAKKRWIKLIVYILIVHFVYLILLLGKIASLILFSILLLIGLWELLQNIYWKAYYIILSYILISTGVILSILKFDVNILIFIYFVIVLFDGFSQITGQLIGKTPLSKTISPNKTIEGAIGGFVFTLFFALCLNGFNWQYVLITILLCVTGLMGDLLASKVKRINKIKDYSQLLPQHGGILDRFDGFFFAIALFYYSYEITYLTTTF